MPPVLASDTLLLPTESLSLIKEKQNAHEEKYGESIKAVQFSPDGTKIVSCGVDKTIKVWDAGARFVSRFTFCHAASLHRSHTFLRPSQVLLSSRQPKTAPTTT